MEFCGPWAFMAGDLLGLLQSSTVGEIRGDPGCPERVRTDRFGETRFFALPFDVHLQNLIWREGLSEEVFCLSV